MVIRSRFAPVGRSSTPLPVSTTSSAAPSFQRSRSLTAFGMTTWPFADILVCAFTRSKIRLTARSCKPSLRQRQLEPRQQAARILDQVAEQLVDVPALDPERRLLVPGLTDPA